MYIPHWGTYDADSLHFFFVRTYLGFVCVSFADTSSPIFFGYIFGVCVYGALVFFLFVCSSPFFAYDSDGLTNNFCCRYILGESK